VNTALLAEGIATMDVGASDSQIHHTEQFVRELELWNRRVNLVKAQGDQILIRHVFDSYAGIPTIRGIRPDSILDAGSGAGFPGIILGIFLPDTSITLLDRSAKRVAFLRNCVAILGLANCDIFEGELGDTERCYDVVTCRAFRPLAVCFRDLTNRLKPGGTLVLYKGKEEVAITEADEIADQTKDYERRLVQLSVPHLQEERHLLLYQDTNR
jgi:16S rRNA (guanine527-N7)-methyltransferase